MPGCCPSGKEGIPMADVKCSIIIPAYNAAGTIKQTLDSILESGKGRYGVEVIVIDDGSADDTRAVVAGYSAEHPEVMCFSKANGGVSSARNEGIMHARAEYIYFMDADDTLLRDGLDDMIGLAERTGADLVIASYYRQKPDGSERSRIDCILPHDRILGRDDIREEALRRFFNGRNRGLPNIWNKLYRADIIREHGLRFDELKTHGEDWQFNIEYCEQASSAWVTCVPVIVYRDAGLNYQKYSRQLAYSLIDEFRIAKRLNDTYRFDSEDGDDYLRFIGRAAEKALAYLRLPDCDMSGKKRFTKSPEEQYVFGYMSRLSPDRLAQLNYSRKDAAAFRLIKSGFIKPGVRIISGQV